MLILRKSWISAATQDLAQSLGMKGPSIVKLRLDTMSPFG